MARRNTSYIVHSTRNLPRGHDWTEAENEYIRTHGSQMSEPELLTAFNAHFGLKITEYQMRSRRRFLCVRNGRDCRFKGAGSSYPRGVGYQHYFTAAEIDFLRDNAALSNKELATRFNAHFGLNLPLSKIIKKKYRAGIKNPNPHIGGREFCTGFKRCEVSNRAVPIGTERIIGGGYIDVKVRDLQGFNNWELKHRIIWEAANGPVPDGHMVIFADGNNRNFELNNLRLISRSENAIINSQIGRTADAEHTDAAIMLIKVKRRIANLEKNKEDANLGSNVSWLTTVPAADDNFKNHLKQATADEIRAALEVLRNKPKSKAKIKALESRLKMLNKKVV